MSYQLGRISNKRRFAIFKSYGYMCQKCYNYSKEHLHLHHIQPVGCGGSDENHNLIPLCFDCHKIVHKFGYKGSLLELRRR